MGKRDRSGILEGRSTIEEYDRLSQKAYRYHPGEAFSHKHKTSKEEADWRGYTEETFFKRNIVNKDLINMALKLAPPFPSSPSNPPKHCVYFNREGKPIAAITFAATYAARRFIDAVLGEYESKWRDDNTIVCDDLAYLQIKCSELEEIMDHTLKPAEKEWEIPHPYDAQAVSIATGERMRISPKKGRHADGEQSERTETARKKKTSNDDTERKAPKRAVPDGYTSLADICAQCKVEPRIARQILRKEMDKPEHGWAFSKKEVDKVVRLIKGGK